MPHGVHVYNYLYYVDPSLEYILIFSALSFPSSAPLDHISPFTDLAPVSTWMVGTRFSMGWTYAYTAYLVLRLSNDLAYIIIR